MDTIWNRQSFHSNCMFCILGELGAELNYVHLRPACLSRIVEMQQRIQMNVYWCIERAI